MAALLRAAADPDFPAEIVLVLSNRPEAPALDRAREAGIAATCLDHKAHPGREAFEEALDATLKAHAIEMVCLAGFMRVLTAGFVEKWQGRMINIHPSLLPSFRGLHTHERALAEGVRLHGCSVHFVVPELDAGPIIVQAAVPVLPDDTPDTLGARVLDAEHDAYPLALRLVATGHARLEGGRCIVDAPAATGRLMSPAAAQG
jgi:phosphoribosylglycinamide formyltransferase-1